METKHKLKVLTKIAEVLNTNNITWAVGASLLLYLRGITDTFHDIDIVILEDDVPDVKKILSSFGTCDKPAENERFKTKYFLEYKIDNVEFDIMAGFTITYNEKDYYFPLKKSDIHDFIIVNGTKIPLQSIQQWKYFYYLMGRHEKVDMIENSLI